MISGAQNNQSGLKAKGMNQSVSVLTPKVPTYVTSIYTHFVSLQIKKITTNFVTLLLLIEQIFRLKDVFRIHF